MTQTSGPDRARSEDVARRAVANVAAATVGLVLTPAFGPVGSAMATGALTPIFEQLASFDAQAAENALNATELGAKLANLNPEKLATWARASPRRLALLADVAAAAWRYAEEEKVTALARLLAGGVTDDARIDIDRLFVAAIRDFEPPHIQVLRHMTLGLNPHDQPSGRPEGAQQEWATKHLRDELPHLADGLDYLLATLDRSGCIARGAPRFDVPSWWLVTPFGKRLLTFLVAGPHEAP